MLQSRPAHINECLQLLVEPTGGVPYIDGKEIASEAPGGEGCSWSVSPRAPGVERVHRALTGQGRGPAGGTSRG